MQTAAVVLIALVLAIHIYIVLLETVLFRLRGRKVFGVPSERVEEMAPVMSNQVQTLSAGRALVAFLLAA